MNSHEFLCLASLKLPQEVMAEALPIARTPPSKQVLRSNQVEETKEGSLLTRSRRSRMLQQRRVRSVIALLVTCSGRSPSGSPSRVVLVLNVERTCVSVVFLEAPDLLERPLTGPLPLRKVGLVVGRSQPNREPQSSHK